ncbi:MAG TPA: hypothetical protein VJZ27_15670, partial [Aggregatilineales bacterium]|nr:hypothetical protein [Aggregatilineales bacterium]
MSKPLNPHHRRSIRLSEYDYTGFGAYFVTLCTHQRACIFGDVVDEAVVLNTIGCTIRDCWEAIPGHFPRVTIDAFVIMPNHMHGIIVIQSSDTRSGENAVVVRARHASPLPSPLQNDTDKTSSPKGVKSGSLGSIVGGFKSAATREINKTLKTPGRPLWLRN